MLWTQRVVRIVRLSYVYVIVITTQRVMLTLGIIIIKYNIV